MTLEMHSRKPRPRVIMGHEIQRRQRHRHHLDLAQLSHLETGGPGDIAARPVHQMSSVTASARSLTCCRRQTYADSRGQPSPRLPDPASVPVGQADRAVQQGANGNSR